jgi:hypothetical protein
MVLVLAGVAVAVLIWSEVPRDRPDAAQARRDFLKAHPELKVERVAFEDHEVIYVAYRVFYYAAGDPIVRSKVVAYQYSDDMWRLTPDSL